MKQLLLLVLALAALAGLYLYSHPQVRSGLARETRHIVPGDHTTTLYKWRDASGHWHLSGHAPPPGTAYETERFRNDTNVVPAEAITGQPAKH